MSIATHIKTSLELPDQVVRWYLADLTDEDLFVRPGKDLNHIAWQLGHLIAAENFHINNLYPAAMPVLPDGFRDRHSGANAASDDRSLFCTKDEYLKQMDVQRQGTLALLSRASDAELLAQSPEPIRYLGATYGAVFSGTSPHWMMHLGQRAVIRRKLGKPPLF